MIICLFEKNWDKIIRWVGIFSYPPPSILK
nr:MAG TPA: hypothetical protein [Crassvirales sp.]